MSSQGCSTKTISAPFMGWGFIDEMTRIYSLVDQTMLVQETLE